MLLIKLPPEMLLKVCQLLPPYDLDALAATTKATRAFTHETRLKHQQVKNDYRHVVFAGRVSANFHHPVQLLRENLLDFAVGNCVRSVVFSALNKPWTRPRWPELETNLSACFNDCDDYITRLYDHSLGTCELEWSREESLHRIVSFPETDLPDLFPVMLEVLPNLEQLTLTTSAEFWYLAEYLSRVLSCSMSKEARPAFLGRLDKLALYVVEKTDGSDLGIPMALMVLPSLRTIIAENVVDCGTKRKSQKYSSVTTIVLRNARVDGFSLSSFLEPIRVLKNFVYESSTTPIAQQQNH